jgi:uncharacterized membrane protein
LLRLFIYIYFRLSTLQGAYILSKEIVGVQDVRPWTLTTERIVIAGVLAAITIILSVVPNVGFIPLPNVTGGATIEHIPTILSGIIAGPIIGIVSGLIFGLVSFFHATTPLFRDPFVAILPRLFIGLTAWATFAALVRSNRDLAAGAAGFVGAVTNTILVVGAIILRGYFPARVIIPAVLVQAIFEAIIAAILTIVLARAFYILESRVVRARDTKPRDELPY